MFGFDWSSRDNVQGNGNNGVQAVVAYSKVVADSLDMPSNSGSGTLYLPVYCLH